ncbi:hypothetical protein PENANT_c021G07309 [Penicillium antarcticum]|uniref:Mediator of RNA polymerase II transcription subunit 11 n=1 Tax=Penicillium antarcticum TaxID=416450 RepID=A0A1V6Q0E4_9EURO|nr:uncharacterized protein N7508_010968 [Penicillium antarcticum]KAJ5296147.1 hypothetical protein N7508_010968 [Penicillium antarcticum]OQD82527.1 hypothetical protein PENANT_c021G07309 [Penicillium antarcticum]
MSDKAPPEPEDFTYLDRIQQLNEVDKDVTKLIHSAGLAIQALTSSKPVPTDSCPAADGSLDSHKARFKEATSQYFSLLSSIDVRLRRQVYALDDAGALGGDSDSGKSTRTDSSTGTSSSANPMDVSRLNSRKDPTAMDKEAEIWAAAREFVDGISLPHCQDKVNDSEKMQED